MWAHPAWQAMLSQWALWELRFPMGAFAGSSLKPTIVYSSSCKMLGVIDAHCRKFKTSDFTPTVTTTTVSVGVDGARRVTGAPGLKSTQSYPQAYGALVGAAAAGCTVDVHTSEPIVVPDDVSEEEVVQQFQSMIQTPYEDAAGLKDVVEYLLRSTHLCIPPIWKPVVEQAVARLSSL